MLHWLQMKKEKSKVFVVTCPVCQSGLWIDPATEEIMKSEKGQRKKGSLDELLVKEKKRMSTFDHKFEATAALEKEKKKKAQEKFAEAFSKVDSDS
ncbi:hypothetical protein ACFLT2_00365 [Acidobacteriota bacterium]